MTTHLRTLVPALAVLEDEGGYSERELRGHSIDWIVDRFDALKKRLSIRRAERLNDAYLANAALYSQEAHEALSTTLEELAPDAEDVAYLTDPNALPDLAALRASGFYQEGAQP